MKLSAVQIQHVEGQIAGQAVPESHPTTPELKNLFGDHTFFLDTGGLHIVEPTEQPQTEGQTANVVRLASWASEQRNSLLPHEPQPTDVFIEVGSEEPDPAA